MTDLPVRLLIVDPQAVLRDALSNSLGQDSQFKILGSVATVAAAQEILTASPIDVVLLELELAGECGTALITWAAARAVRARFLVLASRVVKPDAVWLMRQGVSGIFLKDKPLADLTAAIHTVAQGGKFLDPSCVAYLMTMLTQGTAAPVEKHFTHEEEAVLTQLLEGCTNKEIGVRLGISEAAVKSAVQRLFQKAGVRTRGRLIRFALDRHLA